MGIFAAGETITAAKLNAVANSAGICNALSADTTTSATYDDLPSAAASFTYTKHRSDTAVAVTLHMTAYSTAVSTGMTVGVRIDGVDYDLDHLDFNVANTHLQVSGTRRITGVNAGTYTIQARWYRTIGAGTLTVDTNDWISILAMEAQ